MTMTDTDDVAIKRMADLLRRGATMLAEACPICGAPLLKVGDDIYCASCDKRFVTKQEEDPPKTSHVRTDLQGLRTAVVAKLEQLGAAMNELTDINELERIIGIVIQFLKALKMIDGHGDDR